MPVSKAVHHEADVYCEGCAPDDTEPEAHPQEADVPQNCCLCGRPVEYSLTTEGVAYVFEHMDETLAKGPASWNEVYADPFPDRPNYYRESRRVEVVRDWARDLLDYNFDDERQNKILEFLAVTAEPKAP